MKAVVTGATGAIGAVLCRELKKRAWFVSALVMPGEDYGHITEYISETHDGNILNPESLIGLASEAHVVFHLAARVEAYGSKKQFFGPIVDGTKNMLEACVKKAERFVHVSSIAACGLGRHLKDQTEDDRCFKSGIPYNDAKLNAEAEVKSYNDRFSRGCTIVRPSNVIGPRSVWVDEICRQSLKTTGLALIDQGRHSASLVYVNNLVEGIILAGTSGEASGQTYHFRDDWQVTWKQYLTDLCALIGKKPKGNLSFPLAWRLGHLMETIFTPLGLRPPLTRMVVALMGRNNDVDISKAKKELGWQTQITYEAAIEKIGNYVRDNLIN